MPNNVCHPKPLPDFPLSHLKDGEEIPPHELCAMMDYLLELREEIRRRRSLPKQRTLPFAASGRPIYPS